MWYLYYLVCCLLILNVSFSILSWVRERERDGISAIGYSYNCCFCSKEFLFLLVLGKGCGFLVWHYPGLPYTISYFV